MAPYVLDHNGLNNKEVKNLTLVSNQYTLLELHTSAILIVGLQLKDIATSKHFRKRNNGTKWV